MNNKKKEFCRCKNTSSLTTEEGDFGHWDICCDCGLPIEDGYHYYNHYDGAV